MLSVKVDRRTPPTCTNRSPPRSAARSPRGKRSQESACHRRATSPPCSASTPTRSCARCGSCATRGCSSSAAGAASPSPPPPTRRGVVQARNSSVCAQARLPKGRAHRDHQERGLTDSQTAPPVLTGLRCRLLPGRRHPERRPRRSIGPWLSMSEARSSRRCQPMGGADQAGSVLCAGVAGRSCEVEV